MRKAYINNTLASIMANDFLENHRVVDEIIKLIESARQELVIITPYLNLKSRMKGALNHAKHNGVEIRVFYRYEEKFLKKNKKHIDYLQNDIGAEMVYIERLHTKLYLNERDAVMCSMNMVAGSQEDSQEIGIFTNEERLVRDFKSYSEKLYKRRMHDDFVQQEEAAKAKAAENKKLQQEAAAREKAEAEAAAKVAEMKKLEDMGFCIRTGKRIPFNIKKPLSEEAMKWWSQFEDEDYQEKFCHFSGEESEGNTTFKRPILRKNWNAAKKKHGFR